MAAFDGCPGCVALLLKAGLEPNARDNGQATPLMWAAYGGRAETVDVLAQHGLSARDKDNAGKTPFDVITDPSYGLAPIPSDQKEFTTDEIMKREGQFRSSFRPTRELALAKTDNSAKIVDMLLKTGANPHAKDATGRGALHYVALIGYTEGGNRAGAAFAIERALKALP